MVSSHAFHDAGVVFMLVPCAAVAEGRPADVGGAGETPTQRGVPAGALAYRQRVCGAGMDMRPRLSLLWIDVCLCQEQLTLSVVSSRCKCGDEAARSLEPARGLPDFSCFDMIKTICYV